MFRYRNRLIGVAGAALATASLVASGALAASATTTATGTEHFQLVTTSATSNRAAVIAYGAFTGHATDITGNKVDKFKFANGSFMVAHGNGTGTHVFNPRTCLLQINLKGTYKLGHGTGAYRGISGHGTYRVRILGIGPKSGGKCVKNKPPVAWQQTIQASGPVNR